MKRRRVCGVWRPQLLPRARYDMRSFKSYLIQLVSGLRGSVVSGPLRGTFHPSVASHSTRTAPPRRHANPRPMRPPPRPPTTASWPSKLLLGEKQPPRQSWFCPSAREPSPAWDVFAAIFVSTPPSLVGFSSRPPALRRGRRKGGGRVKGRSRQHVLVPRGVGRGAGFGRADRSGPQVGREEGCRCASLRAGGWVARGVYRGV